MRLSPSRRAVALGAAAVVLPLLPAFASGAPASAAAASAGTTPAPSAARFGQTIPGQFATVRTDDAEGRVTTTAASSRAFSTATAGRLARASAVTADATAAAAACPAVDDVPGPFYVCFTDGWEPLSAPQNAFRRAATRWGELVQSPTVIKVVVSFEVFPDPSDAEFVLGSAGPTRLYADNEASPGILANTYYPTALANALSGFDQNGAEAEIAAVFNAEQAFNYDDGPPAADEYDFETVALHEIGHGLGFLGNMGVYLKAGRYVGGWDIDETVDRTPFIFDRRVVRTSPAPVRTLFSLGQDSTGLAQALTAGDVAFGGPNLTDLRPCQPLMPRLYTPSSPFPGSPSGFIEGTSYSHLDEASFGPGSANALMTPFINEQEVVHDPGPLTLAMLRDMGWKAERRAFSSVLQMCAPSSVNVGSTVTLQGTAPAGSTVAVFFRLRTETDYVQRRTLTASATGKWATTFGAIDDWAYAVRSSDGQFTTPKATVAKPTVAGATKRSFRRGTTVTLSGRGIAGSVLQLRFRLQSTTTSGYPILRNVRVAANGTWSYRTTLTQHHQFFATGVNGQRSATYLYLAV